MIKAVIFDIDGVLLDSQKANRQFYQDFLGKFGYTNLPDKLVDKAFHLTLRDGINFLTKENLKGKINEIWRFALKRYQTDYPVKLLDLPEGEKEIITSLARSYRLAIVTSRLKIGVKTFFKISGLEDYFETIVPFEDYTHPKPDPESLLVALGKMAEKPENAIYVGDGNNDLQAARAAQMKFICFYLFTGKEIKEADANIKNFRKLPDAIKKLDRIIA